MSNATPRLTLELLLRFSPFDFLSPQYQQQALDSCSWEGMTRPALLPVTIGPDASALGGALLPLHANFSPDRDLFLKIAAE